MKQKIFKAWVFVWGIIIMLPTIFCPFASIPIILMVCFEAFILWFGYCKVCPCVDWKSFYDMEMAYVAIAFFGSMMAFILPCMYGLEVSQSWDTWCTVFSLIWLLSIVLVLIGTYFEIRNTKALWKWIVLGLCIMFTIILILSILGCFGIYLM